MRKSKEWNLPEGSVCKKPAVYIVDVAEISCSQSSSLPTAPSSSSVSHDDEENASGRISTSTSSQLVPISHKFDGTGTGTGTGSQPVVCTTNDPVPGSDSRSHSNALVDKISEIKEKLPNDQVNEDSPHAAWYRIIYKVSIVSIDFCKKIILKNNVLLYKNSNEIIVIRQ